VSTFSDGVFAVAITLLVLDLRPPEDTRDLGHALAQLWPSYLAYGVSFLLIGLVWANHHTMFEHIVRVDRPLLFLNTLLLMNVVFIPFTAAVLARSLDNGDGTRTAVALYGLTLTVGGVFFNAVWWWAGRDHRLMGDHITPAEVHAIGRRFRRGPVLYALGAGIGLAVPAAGLAFFAFLIVYYWLPSDRDRGSGEVQLDGGQDVEGGP
jgi:uncharacterized membrane protein